MSTVRTTISIPKSLYELACKRAEELHFSGFSDYLQHLLRDDIIFDESIAQAHAAALNDAPPMKYQDKLPRGKRGIPRSKEN